MMDHLSWKTTKIDDIALDEPVTAVIIHDEINERYIPASVC